MAARERSSALGTGCVLAGLRPPLVAPAAFSGSLDFYTCGFIILPLNYASLFRGSIVKFRQFSTAQITNYFPFCLETASLVIFPSLSGPALETVNVCGRWSAGEISALLENVTVIHVVSNQLKSLVTQVKLCHNAPAANDASGDIVNLTVERACARLREYLFFWHLSKGYNTAVSSCSSYL